MCATFVKHVQDCYNYDGLFRLSGLVTLLNAPNAMTTIRQYCVDCSIRVFHLFTDQAIEFLDNTCHC